MPTKNKSSDSANKGKSVESIWKKAFVGNSEWPDKVRISSRDLYLKVN